MAEKPEPSEMGRDQNPSGGGAAPSSEHLALKGIASLERLRDRVETAANEMKRLRDENASLLERIKELETRPAVDPKGTFLSLDHEPDQLKRKITAFIEAIDDYLERERGRS